ncbi:HPr family phosphocarrier protein [Corynebacterium guangdongense]|uniref:Phosphocarrier protein HPr n=2 Tax=Corynebacterium guangdongense TaxID=1783348 RepID=A0ABU1ZV47_9CORY|nr:beta-glucoside operon transcriptional antiterminator [Corynebacterium guangdongense]WJZ17381.1 Transcription antiterminator LicT [Corynebacterium guangdongense]
MSGTQILRVFNNNVVLAQDRRGEVILTGRGLGFQARPGDAVDESKVVRTFVPTDGRDPDHLAELIAGIPIEYVELVTNAVARAGLGATALSSPTLIMALADHVHFAVQRAGRDEHIEYPLLAEVRTLYTDEYLQAQVMLEYINSRLVANAHEVLPDHEAVALTLHLVNAGFSSGDLSFTYTMTGVLHQLISTVEADFGVTLDPSGVSVGRFITHLRYLFVRIRQHEQLEDGHSEIGAAIRRAHPEAFRTARRLAAVLELRLGATLNDDEVSYLTLHVGRIVSAARAVQTSPTPENTDTPSRKDTTMISRTATIGSSVGLHARPASLFVQAVEDTGLEILLSFGDEEVDADSVLEVMTLGAKHGDVVTLSCEDDSAAAALDELAAMLERDLDKE